VQLRPRLLFATIVAVVLAPVLALSGCAAADTAAPAAKGATIANAFGETTVPAHPKRVVTLGWGSSEAALALGVVPVAMEKKAYGGDKNGVLPWIAAKLKQLGVKTPTMITETKEAPAYEEIIAAKPDLILATYSGITKAQYTLLSNIAPTVAYPDKPWSTPWKDVISIDAKALGKTAQAGTVLDGIDKTLAKEAAAHPELKGKSVAVVWDVSGTFYVYRPADSRVSFLFDLGLTSAPAVEQLASGDSPFFYTLSYEELDKLKSDILVSFANTDADAATFLAQSYAQAIPAVKTGAVASITGVPLISAVSPPTALSLTWGLDQYVAKLSAAAKVVDAAQ
jgi:iron complex transport system substrate-binding protein